MAINDASILRIVHTVDGREVEITPAPKQPPKGKKTKKEDLTHDQDKA